MKSSVSVCHSAVRLRDERLSLIKECISQCPTTYKQSTLLLELARLLRVSGNAHTPSITRTHHLSEFTRCRHAVLKQDHDDDDDDCNSK